MHVILSKLILPSSKKCIFEVKLTFLESRFAKIYFAVVKIDLIEIQTTIFKMGLYEIQAASVRISREVYLALSEGCVCNG